MVVGFSGDSCPMLILEALIVLSNVGRHECRVSRS